MVEKLVKELEEVNTGAWTAEAMVIFFTHLFIQQTFIEILLCPRHTSCSCLQQLSSCSCSNKELAKYDDDRHLTFQE